MRSLGRRDPAPSMLRYRLSRMWLSRRVRAAVRFGPLLVLLAGLVAYVATDRAMRAQLAYGWHALRGMVVNRDEFRIATVAIHGTGQATFDAVSRIVVPHLPASSLDLDLAGIRAEVEALPAVKHASVRIGRGSVLQLDVLERLPVTIWRHGGRLSLLDPDGTAIGTVARRSARPDLPLVLGAGADGHVREALELLVAAAPVAARVRAVQRIADRRWNLVLDREQTILLPQHDPAAALRRFMGLHAADKILARDVTVVDMRNGDRPVLRLGAVALSELRGTGREGDDQ